jgi:hypothetical protein
MRTIGETQYYCIHCGFDVTHEGLVQETTLGALCPSRDGDFCEGKRRQPKPMYKRGREGGGDGRPGLRAPPWVKAALRDDEEAAYDPTVEKWYGIRDGDWREWRNVRELVRP